MMLKRINMVMALLLIALLAMHARQSLATALTAARDTPERDGQVVSVGVAASNTIYAGSMVALNTSGYAVPASDTTGYLVIGRAQSTVDNSTGADDAVDIEVRRGIFRWANGDTFTIADIGDLAYVEDDQTVQKAASATYDVVAGLIIDVDSDGVWVDSYAIGGQGASSVATLSVAGAVTITEGALTDDTVTTDDVKDDSLTLDDMTLGGLSTNITYLSATGVTGALYVVDGVVTNFDADVSD